MSNCEAKTRTVAEVVAFDPPLSSAGCKGMTADNSALIPTPTYSIVYTFTFPCWICPSLLQITAWNKCSNYQPAQVIYREMTTADFTPHNTYGCTSKLCSWQQLSVSLMFKVDRTYNRRVTLWNIWIKSLTYWWFFLSLLIEERLLEFISLSA